MIDREKIVEGLEHCVGRHLCSGCGYYDPDNVRCQKDLMRDALALLKPVKPIEQTDTITRYNCGFCGNRLFLKEHMCHWCGREIKWDDKS